MCSMRWGYVERSSHLWLSCKTVCKTLNRSQSPRLPQWILTWYIVKEPAQNHPHLHQQELLKRRKMLMWKPLICLEQVQSQILKAHASHIFTNSAISLSPTAGVCTPDLNVTNEDSVFLTKQIIWIEQTQPPFFYPLYFSRGAW